MIIPGILPSTLRAGLWPFKFAPVRSVSVATTRSTHPSGVIISPTHTICQLARSPGA